MMELNNELASAGLRNTSSNLKGGTNKALKKGQKLLTRKHTGLGLRPRPLQASTNTIHATQPVRVQSTLKAGIQEPLKPDDLKKKLASQQIKGTTVVNKVDENHTSEFFDHPYDASSDIYALDEELYKKVCGLELADDGLPSFKIDEPFDF